MREAHFIATEAPKLQAAIEAMLADVWGKFIRRFWLEWHDDDLQQQRMTDDGCPLGP